MKINITMDVPMFLLAFAVLWETSLAIKCYRCLPERTYIDQDTPLCEGFDYSVKFIKDCPHSTGCIKKTTQLLSLVVNTKSIERDCAHQTMDGYQEKRADGKWAYISKIHEVYEEGCKEDPNEYDKPTKSTKCFCRGDRCNSTEKLTRGGPALVMIVAFWMMFIYF